MTAPAFQLVEQGPRYKLYKADYAEGEALEIEANGRYYFLRRVDADGREVDHDELGHAKLAQVKAIAALLPQHKTIEAAKLAYLGARPPARRARRSASVSR